VVCCPLLPVSSAQEPPSSIVVALIVSRALGRARGGLPQTDGKRHGRYTFLTPERVDVPRTLGGLNLNKKKKIHAKRKSMDPSAETGAGRRTANEAGASFPSASHPGLAAPCPQSCRVVVGLGKSPGRAQHRPPAASRETDGWRDRRRCPLRGGARLPTQRCFGRPSRPHRLAREEPERMVCSSLSHRPSGAGRANVRTTAGAANQSRAIPHRRRAAGR
jgi:hypothetical protein